VKIILSSSLLSLFILLSAAQSTAQNATGTIAGVVRDLRGTPVPRASVYAVDENDMRRRISTTADESGRFVLPDVPAGIFSVHAYKESAGYPDTFFSFFAINERAWQQVQVEGGRTTGNVVLRLGPRYAVLKLTVSDEQGNPLDAVLTFTRVDDPKRPYSVGSNSSMELLVPPTAFRLQIESKGYELWRSGLIKPRSGETVPISARLRHSR
jgi:hypothetical protein